MATAPAVSGTSAPMAHPRRQQGTSAGAEGAVRTIAATMAWHRAHDDTCASAALTSAVVRSPSIQAASVSASRQRLEGSLADGSRTAERRSISSIERSRSGSRVLTGLLSSYRTPPRRFLALGFGGEEARQVNRPGIVHRICEALCDFGVGEPRLVAQPPFDLDAQRLPGLRHLSRNGRFVLAGDTADFGERQLLSVITAQAPPVSRIQRSHCRGT